MSISSSMNAGVMGLQANSTKLAVISDNIANSSTFGYKRSVADFSSLVIGSGGGSYSAGGVRSTNSKLINERGSLIGSSNSTDIAVRGRGMFPVTRESAVRSGQADVPMLLQTTGSFRPDFEGYLASDTGLILMGWPVDAEGNFPPVPRDSADALVPVQIRANEIAGEPTTQIGLGVNLPASATQYTDPPEPAETEILTQKYVNNVGLPENLRFEFTPVVPNNPAGSPSNEWTMRIFDGAQEDLLVGQYRMEFNDSRAAGGTLASVTTIAGGNYQTDTGTVRVQVSSGPIDITLGLLDTPSGGLSQLSNRFGPTGITFNGAEAGTLVEVDIDSSGIVSGLYSSGVTRTLYQIPLADVPNPDGLLALDDQTYQTSRDSGAFFLWDAGDGPTGDMVNFAREESTTDVANELTEMIRTQRAYSSNAKVIQTVDEMLQETTNIKR